MSQPRISQSLLPYLFCFPGVSDSKLGRDISILVFFTFFLCNSRKMLYWNLSMIDSFHILAKPIICNYLISRSTLHDYNQCLKRVVKYANNPRSIPVSILNVFLVSQPSYTPDPLISELFWDVWSYWKSLETWIQHSVHCNSIIKPETLRASVGRREVSWKVKQGHEGGGSVPQKLQHDITQLLCRTGWGVRRR
jgi:hypothetical protein